MDMFPQREQSPREFWLAHVKAWRASGLKKKEYCEVHGLKATTMGYWCRAQAETPSEAPLTLIPINQPSGCGSIAIIRRNAQDWELSLPLDVTPGWVAELLKSL